MVDEGVDGEENEWGVRGVCIIYLLASSGDSARRRSAIERRVLGESINPPVSLRMLLSGRSDRTPGGVHVVAQIRDSDSEAKKLVARRSVADSLIR